MQKRAAPAKVAEEPQIDDGAGEELYPHLPLRMIVTAAALALVAIRLIWPSVFEGIDAIALALLLAALLPWLTPLVEGFEIPGLLKVQLRTLVNQVETLEGRVQSAEKKTDLATTVAAVQTRKEPHGSLEEKFKELRRLADEYNTIRATEERSALRTSNMTRLVHMMIPLAQKLSVDTVKDCLLNSEADRGRRLAGFAAAYGNPSAEVLGLVVDAVVALEDKPFGQYWGILAIQSILRSAGVNALAQRDKVRLQHFRATLRPSTDRHYELGKILQAARAEA